MTSIKSRMMLTSLIVLSSFLILTALALEQAIEKRMLKAEEDGMQALIYSILAAVDRDSTGLSIIVSDARLFENALFDSQSGLYAQLYDDNGEIWRSLSTVDGFPEPQNLAAEELRFSQVRFNGESWFQLAFSIYWPDAYDELNLYKLVLWKSADDYFVQLKQFRQILWTWLLVTIALMLVVMWLVMLWSLRPLRQIGDEVRAIEDGRKQRFGSHYPAEIKPLTQNLNLLLQREQHQMQRYRHALDDLAHSLKTPLAVLRGLEQRKQWSEEDRVTLVQQNQRMNQIVSYQLQKAATVGGDVLAKPIELFQLLSKTTQALNKVYQAKAIDIQLQADPETTLRMDESDLLELLGNLIDNACKYGRRKVRVRSLAGEGQIRLSIEDDGDGLEQDKIKKILTRGARLDQSQEGQGIGLAVVHEIVQAYEIGMDFSRSSLGGLKVELTFSNN